MPHAAAVAAAAGLLPPLSDTVDLIRDWPRAVRVNQRVYGVKCPFPSMEEPFISKHSRVEN
jgi:hypothetical protein